MKLPASSSFCAALFLAGFTASTQLVPEDLKVAADGDLAFVSFNIRSEGSVLRRTFIFQHQAA